MAIVSVSLAAAAAAAAAAAGGSGPPGMVRKESHPVLIRQKRDWIWNSLYVEEEKPAPVAYKIGQVGSSRILLHRLLAEPWRSTWNQIWFFRVMP